MVAGLTTFEPSVQPSNEPKARKRADVLSDFETWYEGFPNKVNRGHALKAFPAALAKTSLQEMIDGLARYRRNKPADVAWCNPATWLNGERWLDEPGDTKGEPWRSSIPPPVERVTPTGLTDEQLRTLAQQQAKALDRKTPAQPLDS